MPDGADMLMYTTPGNYYCTSDARVATFLNCPVKKAFALKVDYANGQTYPRQTFITINNNTIRRTYDPYQSSWVDAKSTITNADLENKLEYNATTTYKPTIAVHKDSNGYYIALQTIAGTDIAIFRESK